MRSLALKLLIAMVALNIVLLPLSATLAVLCGYAILLLSAWVPIDLMLNGGNRLNKKQTNLVLAFLAVTVINSLLSISSLTFANVEPLVKAFVSFFAFLLALSVGESTYTERDLTFYFTVNRLLSLIFVLYTVIPFDFQRTPVGDYGFMQFTLSMGNPNATATKVLFCVLLLVIQIGISKNDWTRWSNALLVVGLLYTIYRLESRTALACAILGIALLVFKKRRVSTRFVNLFWIVPIVFIPIQFLFERFPMLRLLGKSLVTGRQDMFTDFLSQIDESPLEFLLGSFLEHQLANYHNIFFTVLFNFGIVGVALYYCFWYFESRKIGDHTDKLANYAWLALSVFIVQSATEAAAMSGSFTFGAIILLINRLSKDTLILSEEGQRQYDLTIRRRCLRRKVGGGADEQTSENGI